VSGVVLQSGTMIRAKYVISNCDAKQTFLRLLSKESTSLTFINKLNTMIPSLSMFIIYLGVNRYFDSLPPPGATLWYLPHYDIEKIYTSAQDTSKADLTKYLLHVSPDGKSIVAMVNTSFKDKEYWDKDKYRLLEEFIAIIEQSTIPNLAKHIVYKDAATPFTLYKYTHNSQGAAYGWACTRQQLIDPDLRKPSLIKGLYLTGHWTTYAHGLAGVAYLGYDLAKNLIKKEKVA
jgi:prolycopene isomerase